MKKLIAIQMVAGLMISPAVAQSANYNSVALLTMAAQQAAGGQLSMVHGGYMGGGLAAPVAQPQPVMGQAIPLSNTGTNLLPNSMQGNSGSSNAVQEQDSTMLIAAAIGVAAIAIPVAISLFSGDE